MKRKFILAGSLAFYLLLAKGQNEDTPNFKIDATDIEVVYSQYAQTGDNSAVTGGEGTERLTVYGPSFALKRSFGKNILDFQLGADIISSASTDKIDFVMSSASILDARTYGNVGYTRVFDEGRLAVSGAMSLSFESDYYSVGKQVSVSKTSESGLSTYVFGAQLFNDDLRWGRLQGGFLKDPIRLIYPAELRFREWYDTPKRDTYNFNLGMSQVVNARNTIGAFAELTYQEGLLATPFHRVYFTDGAVSVEQLPSERRKGALAVRWNTFVGGNVIVKSTLSGYADSFGIQGIAIENETAIKLNPRWNIIPGLRFYTQSAADYFAPYQEHDPSAEYYSSDHDLSQFESYDFQFSVRHIPPSRRGKATRPFALRYNYYRRSDNLSMHSLSLVLGIRSKRNPGGN